MNNFNTIQTIIFSGDYESLLMLHKRAPKPFCPSMNVKSLILFLQFKTRPRGSVLMHDEGLGELDENIVRDCDEVAMKCEGSWKAKVNVDQFFSAISVLHEAHGHGRSDYQEACDDCWALYNNGDKSGCRYHPTRQLWRTGNPLRHMSFQNSRKTFNKNITAKPSTASQISPDELIKIRAYLLGSGKADDFELFTVILIAIRIMLRFDDVSQMEVDDVVPDLCIINEKGVQGLCFEFFGKSEQRVDIRGQNGLRGQPQPIKLTLWSDDTLPELCPVRHLLAYFSLTRIKKGFLFPSVKEMMSGKPPDDGHYKTTLKYSDVNQRMRKVFARITGRDLGAFTTHTLKKSGVLFAVWGGAETADIMQACRHRNLDTAIRYRRDANYMLEIHRRHGPVTIPKWVPTFCLDTQSAVNKNASNVGNFNSLLFHADEFMKECGISRTHPFATKPVQVFDACLKYQRNLSDEEILEDALSKVQDQGLRNLVRDVVKRLVATNIRNARSQILRDLREAEGQNDEEETVTEQPNEQQPPPAKRKRGGNMDLKDLRDEIKRTSSAAGKIELFQQVRTKYETHGNELTNACRTFVTKTVNPALNCLSNHFQNSIADFEQRWGQQFVQAPTKFRSKCCNGKPNEGNCKV